MKHFINKRSDIVTEAIDAAVMLGEGKLARLDGYPAIKVVVRADWDRSKVAVISGGGSGHEPAHAGFVGEGMLTAAVCGEIFASPSVNAVLAGIFAVTGGSRLPAHRQELHRRPLKLRVRGDESARHGL
jgi:dihydroxyacetone kinase